MSELGDDELIVLPSFLHLTTDCKPPFASLRIHHTWARASHLHLAASPFNLTSPKKELINFFLSPLLFTRRVNQKECEIGEAQQLLHSLHNAPHLATGEISAREVRKVVRELSMKRRKR